MDYVIELLMSEKRNLEKRIKQDELLHKDMRKATIALKQLTQLKLAIKYLRQKNKLR
ncbi:hypothetical protein AAG747_04235 [Rapidithrix thailandica]|uniref:Uncharacterized protein n=1 Tax=Rapidithrix thailandica TaxID=413964 RepID=A0AAW9S8N6_9BACT